jgi:ABC-type transport system involved in cytochrome c biogenesis permease subunit
MSIHVPVIMVSYAVLAIAFLIAHGQMFVMAATPERSQLVKTIDRLHYLYVLAGAFLLLIGIATGSMWAASSWGRYWGWDPKEVWSLIALLAYLTILHVRVSREKTPAWMYVFALLLGAAVFGIVGARLAPLTMMRWLGLGSAAAAVVVCALVRGPLGDAVKSILAFWLIIMTYVGVNFVLGTGLHSYGFGTGAVVHYLFLFGTIDLILVLVCVGVYYLRYNPGPACARVANRLH